MKKKIDRRFVLMREATSRPPKRIPHTPLVTAPTTGCLLVVVLSQRFECYANHWDQTIRRVVWCSQDNGCFECEKGYRSRVAYYAAVMSNADRKLYTLALPQSAWDWCSELESGQDHHRGAQLKVSRLRNSAQGPVRVEILPKRHDPGELPGVWSVRESVAAALGLRTNDEEEA